MTSVLDLKCFYHFLIFQDETDGKKEEPGSKSAVAAPGSAKEESSLKSTVAAPEPPKEEPNGKTTVAAPEPTATVPAAEPAQPLEQRTRRKERRSNPEPGIPLLSASTSAASPLDTARDDLDFLESLNRAADKSSDGPARPAAALPEIGGPATVVPVQIVAEKDKKELEDWLDDFLAD